MSKISTIEIACPQCERPYSFDCWDSCNVTLQPDLKERVLSGALFMSACPACGAICRVEYPCLYHDMDKRFMVYMMPRYPEETWRDTAMGTLYGQGYTLRLETGQEGFAERVRILDDGLDDRLLEIIRDMGYRSRPQAQLLFYQGMEGASFMFKIIEDYRPTGKLLPVDRSFYDSTLPVFQTLNLDAEMDPGVFYLMDGMWLYAHSVMQRLTPLLP